MARYDLETFLTDIKDLLVANLNTKIAAITSEKNDGLTLDTINNLAYHMQGMDGPQANFDPFVYIGVVNIEGESQLLNTITQPDVMVAVVIADEGMRTEMWKVLLRYQRALKEVFEENFDFANGVGKLTIKSQVPIELQLLNNSFSHKAIGVSLKADLA